MIPLQTLYCSFKTIITGDLAAAHPFRFPPNFKPGSATVFNWLLKVEGKFLENVWWKRIDRISQLHILSIQELKEALYITPFSYVSHEYNVFAEYSLFMVRQLANRKN